MRLPVTILLLLPCFAGVSRWEEWMVRARRLQEQGSYAEAWAGYCQARDSAASDKHRAIAINSVGLMSRRLGRYMEARDDYQVALTLIEKSSGRESPGYAAALHNLGVVHHATGRFDEAVRTLRRALKIRETTLGESNAATGQTLNQLAAVYLDQSRYGHAERLLRRSLAIIENALGPYHPQVAATLENLRLPMPAERPIRSSPRLLPPCL